MKFLELAYSVIKETGRPLSSSEIWSEAEAKSYTTRLQTKGKTPSETLASRIYTAANDPGNTNFSSVGSRPKRFYIPGTTPEDAVKKAASEATSDEALDRKRNYKEKDLHPLLAYYIRNHLGAFPKTIIHSTSKKHSFGEWVHPDMVACYFPQNHWKHDVYDLSQVMGDAQIELYSFELKTHLSFANLRASFFQAVSNSSWAHRGYLVAAEISADKEFELELTRLSKSFEIGVIHLNLEDPDSTEEILTAAERDIVDWDTVDKLMMNRDFTEFIARVKNDISSKEVREEKYDRIQEPEELVKFFEGKQ